MSAGEVVGFEDLSVDVFLEVQNKKKYKSMMYLIDYIAYGLHLCYKTIFF